MKMKKNTAIVSKESAWAGWKLLVHDVESFYEFNLIMSLNKVLKARVDLY